MATLAECLAGHGAVIMQERVFASAVGLKAAQAARARRLAAFDDGVEPAWLRTPANGRGELFRERGMLGADGNGVLPASTGVGIGPADNGFCAMDLIGELGPARPRFLLRTVRQDAASRYGSAFSRTAIVVS